MLAAFAAKLFKLKALSRCFLVLRLEVIAILALGTLKNDFVTHNDSLRKTERLVPSVNQLGLFLTR